ncbi:glycosyltransferase family 2 protein [Candidatus Uhrbacteria bacterium]|nr:glycosyltransferase family 2 protein [Candidatus Uhrbacteria bacterium]
MISLIIPVYNEEAMLPKLLSRLADVGREIGPHEILFVNDGSRDATSRMITDEIRRRTPADPPMRLVSFTRNFGHQVALSAGLDHATGEAVVILDGDLQDPPELIREFIAKWRAGADIVYAVRKRRQESLLKRFCYKAFYRLLQSLTDVRIPLDSGDFCLMDRKVVDAIRAMPEHTRFLRGLRAWTGFPSVGVEYDRGAREAGETKYSFRKLLRLALDGIVSFSTVPLKLSIYLGFFISLVSVFAAAVILWLKLYYGSTPQGWASLMVIAFFLGGVQLFVLGIMGEYLARITTEVRGRPLYIVGKKEGF